MRHQEVAPLSSSVERHQGIQEPGVKITIVHVDLRLEFLEHWYLLASFNGRRSSGGFQ